jgi:predicted Zn finger-like uncharacterized protein
MVMILTCTKCATRYHVDPASLGSEGRSVRCAGCGHRWTAKPPVDAPKALGPAPPGGLRRRAAMASRRRSSPWIVGWLALVLVILVLASAVIGRNEIVARFPASAVIYETLRLPIAARQGLEFEKMTSDWLVEGGISVLVVGAGIVNQSRQQRTVPPIRVILLDDGGRQLQRETFSSKDALLDAGAKTTFTGRLVNPPSQARKVSIAFDAGS